MPWWQTVLGPLGPDRPDTLYIRHELAVWAMRAGDIPGARHLILDVVADRVRVLGVDHPETMRSRHRFAQWTGHIGDRNAAVGLFANLVSDRARVLGSDHRETRASQRQLDCWTTHTDPAADTPEDYWSPE